MAQVPGLYYETTPAPAEVSPLRSDVAGFLGRTRRGPIGIAVRVAEWREYQREFGGLEPDSLTAYATRSYFENGGEIAWVIRLAGDEVKTAAAAWPGTGLALPGHRHLDPDGEVDSQAFLAGGEAVTHFGVEASSPGAWANEARVLIEYYRRGSLGLPEIDIEVRTQDEPRERIRGVAAPDATGLCERVNAQSRLIRMSVDVSATVVAPTELGPARRSWELTLGGGSDDPPGRVEYLNAVPVMGREAEIALVALPDLDLDLPGDPFDSTTSRIEVLRAAISEAERAHDRLVLVDLPHEVMGVDEILRAADALASELDPLEMRSAAIYHPRVSVPDPLGFVEPHRFLPPSGPVSGLISRLDRERGAHHTPANAALWDAVDAEGGFAAMEQGRLNERGINLIRCFPSRGLMVWGGRTQFALPEGRFVAHRRLIHRLVRAIRRVAQPLVFDINGPELWLAFVRAITSVLLEAWRAGALKGARPEEAFRVKCDDETNPPELQDLGQLVCEIEVAPAVPMEYIKLRVAVGREGELEVFES
ncbi:MAG: phage tail sheath family protein [bacterium]|nr:phage tail sheath family protein [bacterium]